MFACMEDAAEWGVGGVVIDSMAAFQFKNLLLLICIQSVNCNSSTCNKRKFIEFLVCIVLP